jgi:hypothetical protein
VSGRTARGRRSEHVGPQATGVCAGEQLAQ